MATALARAQLQHVEVVETVCKSMERAIGARLGGCRLKNLASVSRGPSCEIPSLRALFPRRAVLVSAIKGKSEPVSRGKASAKRAPRKKKVVEEEEEEEEAVDEGAVDEEAEEYDWPPLVCCFGEAHYEFIPSVRPYEKQMDEDIYSSWKGLQWSPPEFARAPGSSPSNVAVALARLGGKVVFMGKVGNDVLGHELLLTLNTNGVQTRGVKIADRYGTGVSLMRLTHGNGAGIQMTCETPNVEATLQSDEVDLDILKEARMFQFTSISLMYEPLRSTLLSSINTARKGSSETFFDVNLPLPFWKSREATWTKISAAWRSATMIEVTKQELEFLLGEELYQKKRARQSVYFSKSVAEMKQLTSGREEYHYLPEELAELWHKDLRILFVTDGTWRIHYYTPSFHGSVAGTEDVLVAPFSCDRTGSGDAVIAAIIRKLTTQPQLLLEQEKLEKALRFAICAGIVSQWTVGAIRGFPTESAAQNLTEQVFPNCQTDATMGRKACRHDHSNAAKYAMCSSIRYNIKQTYGLDFAPSAPRHVEIPPFYGDEGEHVGDEWMTSFEAWAAQENLNSKKKVQLVHLGLFGDAYEWARELNLERAKWKEFVCLFRERFAGDPTPWAGSPRFPYWLYFNGTARPTVGQVQGRAGVGIVIVSPLKEFQIANVSQYLGRFCSVHVAEFTALVMGMETALQRGVRHLTIMCDSELVFNQVTAKWIACHSSIRDLKLRVQELLNEFQTCGALHIPPKRNTEAQSLAQKAIESAADSTTVARSNEGCGAQAANVCKAYPDYKAVLCRDWDEGYCRSGMRCTRAHGFNELRT